MSMDLISIDDELGDMKRNNDLEPYRLEYETLHRALKRAHESERRLINK